MADEIFVIAIVFGSIVAIVFMGIVSSLIKAGMKRKSGSLSDNKEFLSALREFKEKTDKRLSNLEAIVSDEYSSAIESTEKESRSNRKKNAIEIELENDTAKEEGKQTGGLRNMLNQ